MSLKNPESKLEIFETLYFLILFRTINYSVINYLQLTLIVINKIGNLLILLIQKSMSTWKVHSTMLSCNAARKQASPGDLDPEVAEFPRLIFESSEKSRDEVHCIFILHQARC